MPRRQRSRRERPTVADPPQSPRQRQLRVAEELRHILAQLFRQGSLRDPALADANITVTEVRISPDLRNATVFVMPLAGSHAEEILAALRRAAPVIKGQVGRELSLRRVPNLVFALDESFDRADRIGALLARPDVERDLHSAADLEAGDEPA